MSVGAERRSHGSAADLKSFLEELWPDARAHGIARTTFDSAFAGVTLNSKVLAATRKESEYGKPFGAYVASVASPTRIAEGKKQASRREGTLAAIESKFGVDRWVILGIWGIETSFGADHDHWDVIGSLATLAQARYRAPYFRNELLAALRILQEGHISRSKMVGSWAGAMGPAQFMPSNFLEYAVDFSDDGRIDIWTNVPDILASIANYLRLEGWKPGSTWGFEVVVPTTFDYRRSRASFKDWRTLGVKRADNGAWPEDGEAIIFFPSGASGPAFLVTENFLAVKQYNNSDVYAVAMLHLADRMRGLGPIRAAWPKDDYQLTREERRALQRKLAELGYTVRDFDGRFDFDLRDAIREVQREAGIVPDGAPNKALLNRLQIGGH